jgi:transcriptional regulator with XRE-family HTH domain
MTEDQIIGQAVKLARIAAGYDQTDLADLIGYKNKTTLSKIETGAMKIKAVDLLHVAYETHLDLGALAESLALFRQQNG